MPTRAGDVGMGMDTEALAEDKANPSAPRPMGHGDNQAAGVMARSRGRGLGGSAVKEGAATDQEEGGGSRERGRPNSASSDKSFKLENALSSMRIAPRSGGDGHGHGHGLGEREAPRAALLMEGGAGERRGRADGSRSPLPHDHANGNDHAGAGEDDASVLDTPLRRQVIKGSEACLWDTPV